MILRKRKRPKMGIRKSDRVRSPGHLAFVRRFQCCVVGHSDTDCGGRIEAAHVRIGSDGGTGLKPGDDSVVPLCSLHHNKQHQMGEISFGEQYNVNLKIIAAGFWDMSVHRIKHEQRRKRAK